MEDLRPVMFEGYEAYKSNFDEVVRRSTEDFVHIGYLLKYARDTNVLAGSGYETIAEFAQAEYGLEKTQVSRFMAINDRFSKDGYSLELDDKYKGFGSSKLGIMLTLSDEVAAELSPEMSKNEINVIKKEIEEENQITDFEVFLEKGNLAEENLMTEQQRIVCEFMKAYPQEYKDIFLWWSKVETPFPSINEDELLEIFAPNGSKTFMVRVQGLGKYMITFGSGRPVSILNVRTNEKQEVTLSKWMDATCRWVDTSLNPLKSYSKFFGGTEQPEEEMAKPKDTKVKVQTPHKNTVTPKKENKEIVDATVCDTMRQDENFMPEPEKVIEGEFREVEKEEVAPEQQEPKFEVREIIPEGEQLDTDHHRMMAGQYLGEAVTYIDDPECSVKSAKLALEIANKAIIELIMMIKGMPNNE